MIITKDELKEGKLDKEIVRQIKLMVEHFCQYSYDPYELTFKIKKIPDGEGYQ